MAKNKKLIGLVIASVIVVALIVGMVSYPKISCESQGGIYGKIGLAQTSSCNLPTKDGGKYCTTGSQCEAGICLASGRHPDLIALPPQLASSGHDLIALQPQCPNYKTIVGCLDVYEYGKIETLCVD